MSEQIMVSVFMTAFNHSKYVVQALDGVRKQKIDFQYEVVLYDDASTDNTQEIVREYVKQHPEMPITLILQTENLYSQYKPILSVYVYPRLHGKYMISCECDDYWIDENKLQRQVDFLESHLEYIGVGHNCLTVDENGQPCDRKYYQCYGPYKEHKFSLREFAYGAFPGQTATLMYRREPFLRSLEQHGAEFRRVWTTYDKKRNLELLLLGDLYYLQEQMSAYRIVIKEGSSWSASHYTRNRLGFAYVESIDCRRYARKIFGRHFPNEYASFHAAVFALVKRFQSPSPENREVVSKIVAKEGGWPRFLFRCVCLGVAAFPQFVLYKTVYKNKYLLR